ncbi:MAG: hypothetical protein LBR68_04445 [Lachnoclostridium sp.]|jgi:phenylacetate-CoA ligase|nr:hypothetical protein [Lachnoclostridium sp.]
MDILKKSMEIEKIVNHAITTVPFYMDSNHEYISYIKKNGFILKNADEWGSIPFTKKEDIVLHGDSFISAKFLPYYLQNKLLRVRTSGSTGKCVEIYWNHTDNYRSLISLWLKRKKYYQINPHDRHCYFYTTRESGKTERETEDLGYARGFCKCDLNDEKLIRIWAQMVEYAPVWLSLQPSMATLLSSIVENYDLPQIPSLRYIELTGEMLLTSNREKIEKNLKARIANQYGCMEMNSIAYECSKGQLHCMEDNVFTEILDHKGKSVLDGEEGEIYLTTLRNYAMPLIRYRIGDRGRFSGHQCGCGNREKVIEITNGRSNDWVIDNNGKRINAYIFIRCINNINQLCENAIYQFQVIQHKIGQFTVMLVVDDEFEEEDIEGLFKEHLWQTSLSGANFNFIFHASLYPDDCVGKLKWFINEID